MQKTYIHGYDQRESRRLQDQASTLTELLHADIISVDISEASIAQARERVETARISNVKFQQADIFHLPFKTSSFDHVFVCFVLEHLSSPLDVLVSLKKVIRPGGTITVIEGDHGSVYFYPDSNEARKAIECQIKLQKRAGGNALIGRELYPLLNKAGFHSVRVSPRMVYVDSSKPALVEGFTKKTFTAMIEGVRETALSAGLIDQFAFDKGIRDLYRTAGADGVFCYSFFKAFAAKGA
ncbi:MAG: methyltransferase domain-containing protein [Dissulfurispiraceae bacterium]